MKCRLTRLTDNGHTRTKDMVGETTQAPTVGSSFVVTNDEPLVRTGGMTSRMIYTTTVKSMEQVKPGTIRFKTENTEYLYEELP